MHTELTQARVKYERARTCVCTCTVSRHRGDEGAGRHPVPCSRPTVPGLAKASPCHLCPLGMIASLMVVSKDSKQTRRPQACLSGLLPQHPHHTLACSHSHTHTHRPALAGKRGRNLLGHNFVAALCVAPDPVGRPSPREEVQMGNNGPRRPGWHFPGESSVLRMIYQPGEVNRGLSSTNGSLRPQAGCGVPASKVSQGQAGGRAPPSPPCAASCQHKGSGFLTE